MSWHLGMGIFWVVALFTDIFRDDPGKWAWLPVSSGFAAYHLSKWWTTRNQTPE